MESSRQNLPAVQSGKPNAMTFPAGSVVNFDEDAVLLVRETGADGALVLATGKVKLTTNGGGLVEIGSGKNKAFMVDSKGLYAANQVAGLSVVTPDLVAGPGGRTECNPFLERDDDGYVQNVYLRKMAIGLSPLGNLVIADTTLVLNARAYFMESLAKRIGKFPQAGTVGHADTVPGDWTVQPKKWNGRYMADHGDPVIYDAPATLRYYPGPMGMGIWADHTHPEIQSLISDAIQNERFFVRKAETIAERRVLSKHPAINLRTIPASKVKMDGELGSAVIPVVYRHNPLDKEQQQDLANRLAKGQEVREMNGHMIEVQDGEVEDVTPEAEAVADGTEVDEPGDAPATTEGEGTELFDGKETKGGDA